jgi:uncharacterized protein
MQLREKDRQALLQIFSTIEVPVEVWAYGSRVHGSAHEGSDLDLVIRGKGLSPVPIAVFNRIYARIKDSNIPILVELLDWAKLPERFKTNIEQRYETLFSNLPQIETELNGVQSK